MPNSTNYSTESKQSTNFSKAQLTAGTSKIYDNTGIYDDSSYYDGIVVLSETEDGATNFAEVAKNSTNFTVAT